MLLWGGFAYLAFLVPPAMSAEIFATIGRSGKLLALILFCATSATLPIQAANLGEGWADAFKGEILHGILFESSIGPSWFAQLAVALLLLGAAMCAPQRRSLLACLAGLFLGTRLLIGHAVMLQGPNEIILRLSYLTHLLAAGAWVGALWPVLLIMRAMTAQLAKDQTTALRRFSIAGHVAVTLTVLSGLVNGVLIRGRVFSEPSSAYDAMLILKIAVVAVMISIAVINRYAIVPRLRGNANAVGALRVLTAAEFALALLVLVIVNLLSTMDPH